MGKYLEMIKSGKARSAVPTTRAARPASQRKHALADATFEQSDILAVLEEQGDIMRQFMQTGGGNMGHSRSPGVNANGYGRGPAEQKSMARKHTLDDATATFVESPYRFYEEGFFQDCSLERPIMNTLIMPRDSILSMIPVRANNNVGQKFGFLTALDANQAADDELAGACDDCAEVSLSADWCKMEFPYGRKCIGSQALETNDLIRKACRGEYDDFFFVGSVRGAGATPQMDAMTDRNLIMAGALQKQWWAMGRMFQTEMLRDIWTGDPTNNVGDNRKFSYGLTLLINGDYPNSGLPLEGTDAAKCAALNSDVKDFGGECLGSGSNNIVEYLEALEYTLYERARGTGLLPVRWGIFMPTEIWKSLTEVWPCEVGSYNCNPAAGVEAHMILNSVGGDVYQVSMRERMRQSMTLTLNGRTYPVFLDDGIPIVRDPDAAGTPAGLATVESSIFFVPFTAGGQQVLWIEHIDYSRLVDELPSNILPGIHLSELTWTDGGRWHHSFSRKNWCFKVQTKHEWRLIFIAPFLAGRLDGVRSCNLQPIPRGFENGEWTGQLANPAGTNIPNNA